MKIYLKIKGKFSLESKFTTAFLKEFKAEEGWAFKIPDIIRTIKPFDWFGVNEAGAYFCEVKMIDVNTFQFSQLRNNQYTALSRIHDIVKKFGIKNIFPIVMVYSKKFSKYKVINFSEIIEAEEKGKTELKFLF